MYSLIHKNLLYVQRNKCSSLLTFFLPIGLIFLVLSIIRFVDNNLVQKNRLETYRSNNFHKFNFPDKEIKYDFKEVTIVSNDHQYSNTIENVLESNLKTIPLVSYFKYVEDFKRSSTVYDLSIEISDNKEFFNIHFSNSDLAVKLNSANNDLISLEDNEFLSDSNSNKIFKVYDLLSEFLLMEKERFSKSKKKLTLLTSPLPYKYNDNGIYFSLVLTIIPTFYTMSFFPLFFQIIHWIMIEKETKIKNLLYNQGIKSYIYFFSFHISFLIISLFPMIITSYLLNYYLWNYVSIFVILFFIFLFIINLISIGFVIQSILNTSESAQTIGKIFFIALSILASMIALPNGDRLSFLKIILCYFPQILFNETFQVLNALNNNAINVSFLNLGSFFIKFNSFSLFKIILLFFLDFIIFFSVYLLKENLLMSNMSPYSFFLSFIKPNIFYESKSIDYVKVNLEENFHEDISRCKISEANGGLNKSSKSLVLSHVSKTFSGEIKAVQDFSFEFHPNEIFVLLGHNGAGKSTLINLISGLETVDQGEITLNNISLLRNKEFLYENIGLCAQDDILFPFLTVEEHLKIISEIKNKTADKSEIEELLSLSNLSSKRSAFINELSVGQKRRLSICLALVGKSSIILLDEPTSGMDHKGRKFVYNFIQKIKKDRIIILTTHSLEEAEMIHDYIGIMKEGKFICSGTSEFLKNKCVKGINITFFVSVTSGEENMRNLIQDLNKKAYELSIRTMSREILTIHLNITPNFKVEELFSYIEENKNKYQIRDYFISTSSLEDVFLKINTNDNSIFSEIDKYSPLGNEDLETFNTEDDLTFKSKFIKETILNIKRHFISLWRDKRNFLTEIIFSLLTVLLFISSLTTLMYTIIDSKIVFPLKDKKLSGTFYTDLTSNPNNYYANYFKAMGYKSFPLSSIKTANIKEISNEILSSVSTQSLPSKRTLLYHLNSTESEDTFILLYRRDIKENMFFILNTLLSLMMKNEENISSNYILSINLNRNYQKDSSFHNSFKIFLNFITTLLLVTVYINLSGYNIILPLKEKVLNVKQLQFLSGANMLSYWISFLIVDTFKLSVFILCISPFLLSFTTFPAFYSILIFLETGVSTNIFIYWFISFISKEEDGQKLYLYVMLIGTSFLPIINLFYNIFSDSGQYDLTKIFFDGTINALMPSSVLLMAQFKLFFLSIGDMVWSSINIETAVYKAYLKHLKVTIIQCFFYSTFLFLTESLTVKKLIITKIKKKNNKPEKNSLLDDSEENDSLNEYVRKEKEKLFSGNSMNYTTKIIDLSKTYFTPLGLFFSKKNVNVLHELYLALPRNESFGLLGENGSGKTTTFKCITGEVEFENGKIYFFDKDFDTNYDLIRQNIGYVPQTNALFTNLTVRETLNHYIQLKGINTSIELIVQKLSLEKHLDKLCQHLSNGNKRKLLFGIAILSKPKLLLLDEPSTGVDPSSRRIMWKNIISVIKNNYSCNMILSTHSMEESEILCDRIGWLENGSLTLIGNPERIKLRFSKGYHICIKFRFDIMKKGKYYENILLELLDDWEYINNKDESQLNLLAEFVKEVRKYSGYVKFKAEKSDGSFEVAVSEINDKKGLYCYLINLMCGETVQDFSVGLKSLEEIISEKNEGILS